MAKTKPATKALLPGTVLLWKNEDFHWKLLFQSKEHAASPLPWLGGWMEWSRKQGIPCEAISLLSGRILLLESPVEDIESPDEEGEILLHILIDGKVGWIAMDKLDMKRLEVLG